jgi:hypothetical protein
MSAVDTLNYQLSSGDGSAEPNIVSKKTMLTILDQNTSYNSASSRINTSSISNSTYIDMKNAYLQIPVILTMTGNFSPATAATSADYSVGLMNFYHNIIHSISVMCNGQVVKNHTNYENIYHNFRLTSSISQDGFKNLEHIGFCDDVIASVAYKGSGASFNGNGVSRNKVLFTGEAVSGVFNHQKTANDGLRERIRVIAFDTDGLTDADGDAFSVLQTATKVGQVYKSHIFQKLDQTSSNDDGVLQLAVNMIVPLKTFSIFANCPLHKAAFWELQLNYNHTHGSFTTDGNKKLICEDSNITSTFNGTNPLMITSSNSNQPNSALTASKTYLFSIAVGNKVLSNAQINLGTSKVLQSPLAQQVSLNIPSYDLVPSAESKLISNPSKKMFFEDYNQYFIKNVGSGNSFNELLSSGIANAKSLLLIPYFTSSANSSSNPLSPLLSTWDSKHPSPMAYINNFQVKVAGANVFSEGRRYTRQTFIDNVLGAKGINSGLSSIDGMASGLLSFSDWELAPYYYVNLSRTDEVNAKIPKSISVEGTNISEKAVDYLVFVCYQREMTIDVLTGQIMA